MNLSLSAWETFQTRPSRAVWSWRRLSSVSVSWAWRVRVCVLCLSARSDPAAFSKSKMKILNRFRIFQIIIYLRFPRSARRSARGAPHGTAADSTRLVNASALCV
jgi:hypothetical protein